MPPHTTPFLRALALVLLLAVGPLKAHTAYACEMMDVVVHDVCCCEGEISQERDGCSDPECGEVVASVTSPCCEQSSALSLESDARQTPPTANPLKFRSDVDPPDPFAMPGVDIPQPRTVAACAVLLQDTADTPFPGSRTYLITRRLRI